MNNSELRSWNGSIRFNLHNAKIRYVLDKRKENYKNNDPSTVLAHYIIVEKNNRLYRIDEALDSIRIREEKDDFLESL